MDVNESINYSEGIYMKIIKNSLLFTLIFGTTASCMHASTLTKTATTTDASTEKQINTKTQADLFRAITTRDVELLKTTLAQPNVDVNDTTASIDKIDGYTPLMIAIPGPKDLEPGSAQEKQQREQQRELCIQILLKHPNININLACNNGRETPLIRAATFDHVEILKLLLEHRDHNGQLDLDLNDSRGYTALTYAANEGNIATVELLLADPRLDLRCNNQGNCALLDAEHCIKEATAFYGKKIFGPDFDFWEAQKSKYRDYLQAEDPTVSDCLKIQELIKKHMRAQKIPVIRYWYVTYEEYELCDLLRAIYEGNIERVESLLAYSWHNLRTNNQWQEEALCTADDYITDQAAYGKQDCWKGFKIQELIKTKMKEQGIPLETDTLIFADRNHAEKADTVASAPAVTPEVTVKS